MVQHEEPSAELSRPLQHRSDRPGVGGALQSEDRRAQSRSAAVGTDPHWSKDENIGARTINARCETLSTTPSFRDAFESRRCLIPAGGFYEWRRADGTKVPYAIVPRDEPMFAFAGLWENWRDRNVAGSEWIRTCTIITGPPNESVAPIHDRMPVILPRNAWAKWLGEEPVNQAELQDLLKPYPSARMLIYPISTRVNSVKNDDEAVIEPLSA